MLIDTRDEMVTADKEGFNPKTQNRPIPAVATKGDKAGFYTLCGITLGLFAFYGVTKKNYFNRLQMQINEKASGIEIQLAQRRDTLVKLVDATKSSMKFEKEVLTDVTKLRSQKINSNNLSDVDSSLNNVYSRLMATFEQYPKLTSTQTIRDLMNSAEYLEQELAASRRLYNTYANQFNQEILTFPARVIAAQQKLHTFALFVASPDQRKDVSLKL